MVVIFVFIILTYINKRPLSQSLWSLHGQIKVSIIHCSFKYLW